MRGAHEVHLSSRLGIVLLARVPSSWSHDGLWLWSVEKKDFFLQGLVHRVEYHTCVM